MRLRLCCLCLHCVFVPVPVVPEFPTECIDDGRGQSTLLSIVHPAKFIHLQFSSDLYFLCLLRFPQSYLSFIIFHSNFWELEIFKLFFFQNECCMLLLFNIKYFDR